jgi:hypothetical protein
MGVCFLLHAHFLLHSNILYTQHSTHQLIFMEGGKSENLEKNPQSRGKNQPQTQLTYCIWRLMISHVQYLYSVIDQVGSRFSWITYTVWQIWSLPTCIKIPVSALDTLGWEHIIRKHPSEMTVSSSWKDNRVEYYSVREYCKIPCGQGSSYHVHVHKNLRM